ncbi:MAG: hypothetical protein H7Y18_15005 [Clostridiaceae bacterium]|nr:hypothetical protein [Clostridiaceae bacterium]
MKREANCKCGSLEFKIDPKSGRINYRCVQCGQVVESVSCDEYETLSSICGNCTNDIFKANIIEDDKIIYWEAFCKECGTQPYMYLVSKCGEIISKNTKLIMVIRDSLKDLKEKMQLIEDEIYKMIIRMNDIDYTINTCQNDVYHLINQIEEYKSSMTLLKWEIKELQLTDNNIK